MKQSEPHVNKVNQQKSETAYEPDGSPRKERKVTSEPAKPARELKNRRKEPTGEPAAQQRNQLELPMWTSK